MSKSINTLVKDIYDVIEGKGGWDETVSEFFKSDVSSVVDSRLGAPRESREPTLRLSALGNPCPRKLWYSLNSPDDGEVFDGATLFKFLYGDILESLLISLAKAAGHTVEGCQDELYVAGVRGHRDCVIDGITVDVKSASTFSYSKFRDGALRDNDPFGYISQLSSYVYAGRDQTSVQSHPSLGAFLVVDKTLGNICLDMYDFGPELDSKEDEVEGLKEMVVQPEPPERAFEPEPDGKSGNMKLPINCSYCAFKEKCFPGVRTFLYSGKPRFLTTVVREPNVKEVT